MGHCNWGDKEAVKAIFRSVRCVVLSETFATGDVFRKILTDDSSSVFGKMDLEVIFHWFGNDVCCFRICKWQYSDVHLPYSDD